MHKLLALVFVTALLPSPLLADSLDPDPVTQLRSHLSKSAERPLQVTQAPDEPVPVPDEAREDLRHEFEKRMDLAGHGVLFDIDGKRVNLTSDEAMKLQAEILDAVSNEQLDDKSVPERVRGNLDNLIKELDGLATLGIDAKQVVGLRHLAIVAKSYRLDEVRRSAYLWRDRYLWSDYLGLQRTDLSPELRDIDAKLTKILKTSFGQTDYIRDCELGGVPVPPDFSVNGGAWAKQGNLKNNMLKRGEAAQVWTWASPSLRGACVALPRGLGGVNDQVGIICQGAVSGNACFWDNIDRDTGDRIPWADNTLRINAIEDATMLDLACPACHSGNNAFLVSPDDPTWCRLLRGGRPDADCEAPDGANAGNLTLELEAMVNPLLQPRASVAHLRYTPMSGNPPRSRWTNNAVTDPKCGGSCHLRSWGAYTPPPMPPDCIFNGGCYWSRKEGE